MKLPRAISTAYYATACTRQTRLDKIELRSRCSPIRLTFPGFGRTRVRAADMLYTLGERDVVLYFATDLPNRALTSRAVAALGELTGRRNDARAMLQIGKAALGRGPALDPYAFLTIGIPSIRRSRPKSIAASSIR
jgi:soluble lytic murein transglycosylase